jgi:hypothetical protein
LRLVSFSSFAPFVKHISVILAAGAALPLPPWIQFSPRTPLIERERTVKPSNNIFLRKETTQGNAQ